MGLFSSIQWESFFMTKKLTDEVVEQGVEDLEKGAAERNRGEKALKGSEAILREVIDLVPHAICAHDRKGLHLLVNRKAAELLGTTVKELTGALCREMFHHEGQLNRFLSDIRQVIAGGQPKFIPEEPMTDAEGNLRFLQTSKIPFTWPASGEQVVLSVSTDITGRKRAEEALRESEEKYKTLVEGSLTGIFIRQDGKYVFVNDRFAEIHGYESAELLGKEYLLLIHPDEREALANVESRRLNGEDIPQQYELRRLRRDGRTIWSEMMATRIEYGGRPAIMGNIVDITERKWAEAALRQSKEKLAGIVDSVRDLMVMVDEEFKIAWANNVAKSLLGPDLVGKKCHSAYHGREKVCEPCIVKQSFEDGKVHQFEADIIAPNGNQRTFWCTASVAARDEYGCPKMIVEFLRDITERKRAEEMLRETVHQQQLAYYQAMIYGERLNKQIRVCKRTQEALRKRNVVLKAQARNLEEMNTAMKVLLEHRQEDKDEFGERVVTNVRELVLPYVESLKNTGLGSKQMAYASVIESRLNDIMSPYIRKLCSKHLGLTPKQIQVASLIKEGQTTGEIAELLNASVRAVKFHRERIRAKLGLKNKKANLRFYLLSLQ
jgi:PAS domain S-box-containing protein